MGAGSRHERLPPGCHYINLVAADEDGGAVFVDLNAVHTFDGLEPPTQDVFTASTYMCRGADDKLRIVVVQYEPEGRDVSERMGNVALDTSPLRPRIDWALSVALLVAWGAAEFEFVGDCVAGLFVGRDVVVFE